MKAYQVEPTRKALADADEAFLWLYKEAPEAALRWYDGLLAAFESLKKTPLRCGLARENPYYTDDLRQLVYGRYRIIFTVRDDKVFVLRVRHSARDTLRPDED